MAKGTLQRLLNRVATDDRFSIEFRLYRLYNFLRQNPKHIAEFYDYLVAHPAEQDKFLKQHVGFKIIYRFFLTQDSPYYSFGLDLLIKAVQLRPKTNLYLGYFDIGIWLQYELKGVLLPNGMPENVRYLYMSVPTIRRKIWQYYKNLLTQNVTDNLSYLLKLTTLFVLASYRCFIKSVSSGAKIELFIPNSHNLMFLLLSLRIHPAQMLFDKSLVCLCKLVCDYDFDLDEENSLVVDIVLKTLNSTLFTIEQKQLVIKFLSHYVTKLVDNNKSIAWLNHDYFAVIMQFLSVDQKGFNGYGIAIFYQLKDSSDFIDYVTKHFACFLTVVRVQFALKQYSQIYCLLMILGKCIRSLDALVLQLNANKICISLLAGLVALSNPKKVQIILLCKKTADIMLRYVEAKVKSLNPPPHKSQPITPATVHSNTATLLSLNTVEGSEGLESKGVTPSSRLDQTTSLK